MKRLVKATRRPFRLVRIARMRRYWATKAKRRRLPYENCRNCGQKLHGTYCHNCGQYARDISPSVASFVGQYFENSFQWDGKFFRTIRTLFLHPGRLSVAWAEGHVARYVFPLKLYMFVMVVFGFAAIAVINSNSSAIDKKSYAAAAADFAIKDKIERSKVLDSASYMRVAELLNSKVELVDNSTKVVVSSMKNLLSRLPIVFMFAMPFFAVITRWFFRRRYKKYIPHLVFAIHIHTLFFIIAIIGLIFSLYYRIPSFTGWVTFGGSYLYTVVAERCFFGSRWVSASLKTLLAIFIYLIFCLVILVCSFIANLYYDSLISGSSFTSVFYQ